MTLKVNVMFGASWSRNSTGGSTGRFIKQQLMGTTTVN